MHYIFTKEMEWWDSHFHDKWQERLPELKKQETTLPMSSINYKNASKKMKYTWIAALSKPRWSNQNKRVSAKAEAKKAPNPVPQLKNFTQFLFIVSVAVRACL